jgi:hypothetical protein
MANLIIFISKNGEFFSLKKNSCFFFVFFFIFFKKIGQVWKIHLKVKALKFILFHSIKRPLIISQVFHKIFCSNLFKLE